MKDSIAFFCAEYGIEGLPLYAGGLGILAEDFFLEAGDQSIPFTAIGLYYSGGFHTDGKQSKDTDIDLKKFEFQLVLNEESKPLVLDVDIDDRVVKVCAWVRDHKSARLFLLDTNIEENSEENRKILWRLYDPDSKVRILQQLVLGIGGIKLLRTLGIKPMIYHLNEGHTSFAALALMAEYLHDNPTENSLQKVIDAIRPQIVASKHTILPEAGMNLNKEEFHGLIEHYFNRHRINFDEFYALGGRDDDHQIFSTTQFMINAACRENGVSMLHTVFERQKHPHSNLIPITNGVYSKRWRSERWPKESIGVLNDPELWQLKTSLRKNLIGYVKDVTGEVLNPEALTIVWARRFAGYKRPTLLFSDINRLISLVSNKNKPVQFVIAGKAYESDKEGTKTVQKIKELTESEGLKGKIVYIPDYSITVSKKLVAGADLWLNTPIPGIEACGTSGMKAGLNGALQLSTPDGWIGEVDWENVGWILSEEHIEKELYDTIENKIISLFYERSADGLPEAWIKRVRETINIIENRFTASRMISDYEKKLYFPEGK